MLDEAVETYHTHVDKGTDGIFHYLAIKEAEIRKDPANQTTELLRRVFGSP